ncbi:hypothetical protein [Clostridium thermarum]|uniref:hypothetical protein n=1 Tax=Clostridium thermarum TaxID=1716543 RepID=UPI00111C9A32|nr:hypothetical protein [Clostridium thermarum]
MKKFIPAVIIITLIIVISTLYYNYDTYKKKDLTYVIEQRLTKGIFNRYKLSSISTYELNYSDEILAIVLVNGIKSKAPNTTITYKVLLEKRSNGSWKVKDIYTIR